MTLDHSVVVYENDRLDVLPGDYRGLTDDGIKRLRCVSVHPTLEEARQAVDAMAQAAAECGDED